MLYEPLLYAQKSSSKLSSLPERIRMDWCFTSAVIGSYEDAATRVTALTIEVNARGAFILILIASAKAYQMVKLQCLSDACAAVD